MLWVSGWYLVSWRRGKEAWGAQCRFTSICPLCQAACPTCSSSNKRYTCSSASMQGVGIAPAPRCAPSQRVVVIGINYQANGSATTACAPSQRLRHHAPSQRLRHHGCADHVRCFERARRESRFRDAYPSLSKTETLPAAGGVGALLPHARCRAPAAPAHEAVQLLRKNE